MVELAGHCHCMDDQSYSLSELSRLFGRGKSTLQAMIQDGSLPAMFNPNGRRQWRIRRSDAVSAGLEFRQEASDTIDSVLRRYIDEEVAVIVDHLERVHADLGRQLEAIRTELESDAGDHVSSPPLRGRIAARMVAAYNWCVAHSPLSVPFPRL